MNHSFCNCGGVFPIAEVIVEPGHVWICPICGGGRRAAWWTVFDLPRRTFVRGHWSPTVAELEQFQAEIDQVDP